MRSAFWNVPILDEKYYDALARALASGASIAEINPGFRPLLYPLFLSVGYRLAGDWGTTLAIAAQHLLGVATALLVAALATRLFRRTSAGVLAGAVYLLAGPPLFFEGELLNTTLFTFLVTALLFVLSRWDGSAGWLAAGVLTALAAQARPNVLVFLAAFPLAALALKKRTARAALALGGALAGLLAFAVVQAPFTGHVQLVGGSGGVNLYLGNKRGADGRIPRQDRPVTYGEEYRDSVQVFAEEVYREATGDAEASPGRVSRYWLGRTGDEIRSAPGAWLGLMARKVSYLAWSREIPNNKSFHFMAEHESKVLRHLPVRWWLLFALAPLGAFSAWRRGERRTLAWIGLFIVLYAGSVVLFFVNSRYRVPLWPALAVLAAGGLVRIYEAFAERHWRRLVASVAAAAALAGISWASGWGVEPESYARDFFFRSVARLEKGDVEEALADAERSVALEANDPAPWFQLGTAALVGERPRTALRGFQRAAELTPGEPRIWNNLGVALEKLGRTAEAYGAYRYAIELEATYPPPLVNAAFLELRAGLVAAAEEKIRRAAGLGFESVPFYFTLAVLERRLGHAAEAERALGEATRLGPDAVLRLEADLRRPLVPSDLGGEP